MTPIQSWLRKQGVGRLIYRWVHRPRQQLDLAGRYGVRLIWQAVRGDRAMRRAAWRVPALPRTERVFDRPVTFLTGRHFFHQALFCAHSLCRFAAADCRFEFITDGSLEPEHVRALRRTFPQAIIPSGDEVDAAVRAALPPGKFPTLHAVRKQFVMLRKMTDAMAGQNGYRLVFDSDMLFWAEPSELLTQAIANRPLYLRDLSDEGYTVGAAEISRSLGHPVAKGVNGGLVGLDASRIDWGLIERACQFLWSSAGDRRLLEQTLWAIALADQDANPLDRNLYRVLIDPEGWTRVRQERITPALLHYAWHARLPYSATEWRRYLREAAP